MKGQFREIFRFRFFLWIIFSQAPENLDSAGLGGNWFMKKTRSKKTRDTVPLSLNRNCFLSSSLNISLFLWILMFSSGNSCQILGNLAKGWRSIREVREQQAHTYIQINVIASSFWNSSCLRTSICYPSLVHETGRNPWRNLCINYLIHLWFIKPRA
jgi:hypothetical protein